VRRGGDWACGRAGRGTEKNKGGGGSCWGGLDVLIGGEGVKKNEKSRDVDCVSGEIDLEGGGGKRDSQTTLGTPTKTSRSEEKRKGWKRYGT